MESCRNIPLLKAAQPAAVEMLQNVVRRVIIHFDPDTRQDLVSLVIGKTESDLRGNGCSHFCSTHQTSLWRMDITRPQAARNHSPHRIFDGLCRIRTTD